MSDTNEEAPAAPGAGIPNFRVSSGELNGKPITKVEFGEPIRSAAFRSLEIVDRWDVAEIGGANPSPHWLGMTLMAASLTDIDGVPLPGGEITRKMLRGRLAKLGIDGMNAVVAAMEAVRPAADADDATLAMAKN